MCALTITGINEMKEIGKARMIWHGQWADPEIELVKSHYQVKRFNYYDVEDFLDEEDYPNGFANVPECGFSNMVDYIVNEYGLEPSCIETPDVYYSWSFYYNGNVYEDPEDGGIFMTKSMCLRDALNEIGNDSGILVISLCKNGDSCNVYDVHVSNGAILKDCTQYSELKEFENASLI